MNPNHPVDQIKGVAKPAVRAMHAEGIYTLSDLAQKRRTEVSEWHGMGPRALEALAGALESCGLGFLD